jgi:hypothetical protein
LLIATQVGLCCALLVPSLLLVRSLRALERVDPGFRTRNLVTAYVTLPTSKYSTPVQIGGYYQRLERDLSAWAGTGNAALVSRLPLSFGVGGDPFSIEGRAWGASGTVPQFAHQLSVGPSYFSIIRSPIVEGGSFDQRDFSEPTNRAIVNETLARAFWPNEPALGRRIMMRALRPGAAWLEIKGVVKDVRTVGLNQPPLPQIYRPFPQAPTRTMALIVSDERGGRSMTRDLAGVLRAADPNVPAYEVRTMGNHVSRSLGRQRFRTQLFTGTVCLLLHWRYSESTAWQCTPPFAAGASSLCEAHLAQREANYWQLCFGIPFVLPSSERSQDWPALMQSRER